MIEGRRFIQHMKVLSGKAHQLLPSRQEERFDDIQTAQRFFLTVVVHDRFEHGCRVGGQEQMQLPLTVNTVS